MKSYLVLELVVNWPKQLIANHTHVVGIHLARVYRTRVHSQMYVWYGQGVCRIFYTTISLPDIIVFSFLTTITINIIFTIIKARMTQKCKLTRAQLEETLLTISMLGLTVKKLKI